MHLLLTVSLPKGRLDDQAERVFVCGVTDRRSEPHWDLVTIIDKCTYYFDAEVSDFMSDEDIMRSHFYKVQLSLPLSFRDLSTDSVEYYPEVKINVQTNRDQRAWWNNLRHLDPRCNRHHANIVSFVQERMPSLVPTDLREPLPLLRQRARPPADSDAALHALPDLTQPALEELYARVQCADGPGTSVWRRFRMAVIVEFERRAGQG